MEIRLLKNCMKQRNKPRLSIFIPTFDRATHLRELLITLEELASDYVMSGIVRIDVLDNFSQDETPLICQEFLRRGLLARVVRRDKNIGPDENIIAGFCEAEGDYIWGLCDDDLPKENSFTAIMQAIENHPSCNVLHLNRRIIDFSGREIRAFAYPPHESFLDSASSIRCLGIELLTLSSMIFQRFNIDDGDCLYWTRKYGSGNYIAPLTLALDNLSRGGGCWLTSKPLIDYREGYTKDGWRHRWREISSFSKKVMAEFLDSQQNLAKHAFQRAQD